MRVIIDRFEEDIAVVELGEEMLHIPRRLVAAAREGDTVEITVLGKLPPEGESPRDIFERLRRKSRKQSPRKPSDKRKKDLSQTAFDNTENAAADEPDPAAR